VVTTSFRRGILSTARIGTHAAGLANACWNKHTIDALFASAKSGRLEQP
jgi:hypothetical protein